MAGLALFDLLQDFGKRSSGPASVDPIRPAQPAAPAEPLPDIDAIVRAAVAKAEAALTERLSTEFEAEVELERRRHAGEIDALHQAFAGNAAELIASQFGEMRSSIGNLASSTTARILGSVLTEELQKRSIESLAASIHEAASDRDATRIEVRGPQSLIESMQATLAGRADGVRFVEAPGFDLRVRIDGELFETRLSEWSAALSEILS